MVAWSCFALRSISKANSISLLLSAAKKNGLNQKGITFTPVRHGGGHANTMVIRPSGYTTLKFLDLMSFYLLLGIIPLGLLVTYVNLFIGPAELAAIPEGYTPKPWEYERHPISRFFIKCGLIPTPQEVHEKNMHRLFEKMEKKLILQLEYKIQNLMADRTDYQAWYFDKQNTKYSRYRKECLDEAFDKYYSRGKNNFGY